jgi:hypothetical protein
MTKLLIYIGENDKFDIDSTVAAIESMPGVSKARKGAFIGAIFECEFTQGARSTIVRLSPEAETITAEGIGDESLAFALELQRLLPVVLHAMDMDYSFNVSLKSFNSLSEFKSAVVWRRQS